MLAAEKSLGHRVTAIWTEAQFSVKDENMKSVPEKTGG